MALAMGLGLTSGEDLETETDALERVATVIVTESHSGNVVNGSALVYVNASNSKIVLLDFVATLPNVQVLVLSHNAIETLDYIWLAKSCFHLDLSNNKLKSVVGLERFAAFGLLNISNNQISWKDLSVIKSVPIIEGHFYGNFALESEGYASYQVHLIDCLPHVWLIDGQFVTYRIRSSVANAFQRSELSSKPMRHKLNQRDAVFRPTAASHGDVVSPRASVMLRRFALTRAHTSVLDDERLVFAAQSFGQDLVTVVGAASVAEGGTQERRQGVLLIGSQPGLFAEALSACQEDVEFGFHLFSTLLTSLLFDLPGEAITLLLHTSRHCSLNPLAYFYLSAPIRLKMASYLLGRLHLDLADDRDKYNRLVALVPGDGAFLTYIRSGSYIISKLLVGGNIDGGTTSMTEPQGLVIGSQEAQLRLTPAASNSIFRMCSRLCAAVSVNRLLSALMVATVTLEGVDAGLALLSCQVLTPLVVMAMGADHSTHVIEAMRVTSAAQKASAKQRQQQSNTENVDTVSVMAVDTATTVGDTSIIQPNPPPPSLSVVFVPTGGTIGGPPSMSVSTPTIDFFTNKIASQSELSKGNLVSPVEVAESPGYRLMNALNQDLIDGILLTLCDTVEDFLGGRRTGNFIMDPLENFGYRLPAPVPIRPKPLATPLRASKALALGHHVPMTGSPLVVPAKVLSLTALTTGANRRPRVGDTVLVGLQHSARIIAVPDNRTICLQLDRPPQQLGFHAVPQVAKGFLKKPSAAGNLSSDSSYLYYNTADLLWDAASCMWRTNVVVAAAVTTTTAATGRSSNAIAAATTSTMTVTNTILGPSSSVGAAGVTRRSDLKQQRQVQFSSVKNFTTALSTGTAKIDDSVETDENGSGTGTTGDKSVSQPSLQHLIQQASKTAAVNATAKLDLINAEELEVRARRDSRSELEVVKADLLAPTRMATIDQLRQQRPITALGIGTKHQTQEKMVIKERKQQRRLSTILTRPTQFATESITGGLLEKVQEGNTDNFGEDLTLGRKHRTSLELQCPPGLAPTLAGEPAVVSTELESTETVLHLDESRLERLLFHHLHGRRQCFGCRTTAAEISIDIYCLGQKWFLRGASPQRTRFDRTRLNNLRCDITYTVMTESLFDC